MHKPTVASLVLDNGIKFQGYSFGYEASVAGEIVFNTAMTGYPESLTDPSYSGQLLVFTFPLIGNYGVPSSNISDGIADFFESEKIHTSGVIISDYAYEPNHWNSERSLADWLKAEKIPGIYGIDTRELTKILREEGTMKAKIVIDQQDTPFVDPDLENQVAKVSCKEVITYGNGSKKVIVVDCGIKHNILRCLLKRDVTLIRVPWDYDYNALEFDALFISNGPGDPNYCDATVKNIQKTMETNKPIFGICMGNQLLAKAGGASIYKLKYGHRSHNQPVRMVGTSKCFITTQNHGYAVDNTSLGKDWEPLFINMNDNTNEGSKHVSKPYFSAQFHPEAASGPTDTEFLFDDFINLIP